jgi:hypothetical protein
MTLSEINPGKVDSKHKQLADRREFLRNASLAAIACMTHKLQTTTDHRFVKAIVCRPFDWGHKNRSQ